MIVKRMVHKMQTRSMIIILSIIIASSIIFALTFELPTTEHYEIEITGMKDVYLVGEPYSFSYILSGYVTNDTKEQILQKAYSHAQSVAKKAKDYKPA